MCKAIKCSRTQEQRVGTLNSETTEGIKYNTNAIAIIIHLLFKFGTKLDTHIDMMSCFQRYKLMSEKVR